MTVNTKAKPLASSLSTAPDGDWFNRAACRAPGIDPEIFFPAVKGSAQVADLAKAICALCRVRPDCYQEYVIERPQEFGVFAGLTADERRMQRAGMFRPRLGVRA